MLNSLHLVHRWVIIHYVWRTEEGSSQDSHISLCCYDQTGFVVYLVFILFSTIMFSRALRRNRLVTKSSETLTQVDLRDGCKMVAVCSIHGYISWFCGVSCNFLLTGWREHVRNDKFLFGIP